MKEKFEIKIGLISHEIGFLLKLVKNWKNMTRLTQIPVMTEKI